MIVSLVIPLLVLAFIGYLLYRFVQKEPARTVAMVVWAIVVLAWLIEYLRVG